jgi:hypothetical protein
MNAYGGRRVLCPTCMDEFDWIESGGVWLFDDDARDFQLVDVSDLSPLKQAQVRRDGYQRCPNPSGDAAEHYLPASYLTYEAPLVIGLVGGRSSGKTHLLTAMIAETYAGGLARYGINPGPLDFLRHDLFRASHLVPFEEGQQLGGSRSGLLDYADSLVLRRGDRAWPVTFFDVAGEDLLQPGMRGLGGRFLLGANALIFAHALDDLGGDANGVLTTRRSRRENRAFTLSLERLRSFRTAAQVAELPATIAITKADRLRFVPPADRWLRQGNDEPLTAAAAQNESRDAYAYLYKEGAAASLAPFDVFTRCTLHFVSASGGDASDETKAFPRGVRPMRVLQPLVALLAMAGIVDGPELAGTGC